LLKVGAIIQNLNNILNYKQLVSGNSNKIKYMPIGSIINNIELYPNSGSKLVRSAGNFAQIIKKYDEKYMQIKLKSKEQRLINMDSRVTLGIVSNIYNNQKFFL